MTFAATILTLYPEMFPGPLGVSLAGRALERGDWSCATVNPRDFTTDTVHPELVEGLHFTFCGSAQKKGSPSTSSGRAGIYEIAQ